MTDSTNDRIRQLEAALAECKRERDDAIEKSQYASGFLGVETIERDAMKAEIASLQLQLTRWKDIYSGNMQELIEYCLNDTPQLSDVSDLIEEMVEVAGR